MSAVALAGNSDHFCALLTSGQVMCWGRNSFGALGLSDTDAPSGGSPRGAIVHTASGGPALDHIVSIATGADFTCAVTSSGGVKCWGYDGSGELGDSGVVGATSSKATPYPVDVLCGSKTGNGCAAGSPLTGVVALAAGEEHACAILASHALVCWGRNQEDELTTGPTAAPYSTTKEVNPVPVVAGTVAAGSAGTAVTNALLVSSLNETTCIVTSDTGVVECWGANNTDDASGSFAPGTANPQPYPNQIPSGAISYNGAIAVSTGAQTSCVLSGSDNIVYCWGTNYQHADHRALGGRL